MARIPVLIMVADPATGNAMAGVAATVKNRASGVNVTLYAAETGPTTVANPLTTDAYGRAQAWADRAALRIDYAGTGLTSWTESRDVGPSGDRGIDSLLLPAGTLPTVVTAPAALPTVGLLDGDEVLYIADAANGIVWHLRYRAAAVGSYKWEFVGGPPMLASVATQESTSSTSYVALTTAGPSLTLPLAGDYDIGVSARILTGAFAGSEALMSYDVGATAAIDADAASISSTVTSADRIAASPSQQSRKTVTAAATAVVSKYKASGGGSTSWMNRRLWAQPVRVG